MIVGREEHHVSDLILRYELEQVVTFGAVATDVRLATIGADRSIVNVARLWVYGRLLELAGL